MSEHGHDSGLEQDGVDSVGRGARRPPAAGKSTLTSRLGASPASIARAVVAQMKEESSPAPSARTTPSAVQARGDLAGPDVHAIAAHGTAGSGGPLPFLDEIQRAFGHHDVSGVRAHVGGAASEASAAIGARAYAAGDDVAFAAAPDLHLAAHEAAHVVQQRGGVRLSGGVGRAGDGYERHADAVADGVVRGDFVQDLLGGMAHRGAAGGPAVQRDPPAGGAPAAPAPTPAQQMAQCRSEERAEDQPTGDAAEGLPRIATIDNRQAATLNYGVMAAAIHRSITVRRLAETQVPTEAAIEAALGAQITTPGNIPFTLSLPAETGIGDGVWDSTYAVTVRFRFPGPHTARGVVDEQRRTTGRDLSRNRDQQSGSDSLTMGLPATPETPTAAATSTQGSENERTREGERQQQVDATQGRHMFDAPVHAVFSWEQTIDHSTTHGAVGQGPRTARGSGGCGRVGLIRYWIPGETSRCAPPPAAGGGRPGGGASGGASGGA